MKAGFIVFIGILLSGKVTKPSDVLIINKYLLEIATQSKFFDIVLPLFSTNYF